jgi:lipopolysaccharide export system permease protein
MGRIDRYILTTAGGAFLAVLLVLTSMIWLTQALRRFDLLTNLGQTLWVFLIITGLSLPTLILVTAPIALFIALIYTFNKLNADSELIVMGAAGLSPWQLIRAPLILSLTVATCSLLISTELSPRSLWQLRTQLSVVNADIVTNVAVPGRFTKVERDLVFHVRERNSNGALLGIFINDARESDKTTTYLADRGMIVSTDSGLFLVLEQGSMHRSSAGGKAASLVEFERYAFDLSRFGSESASTTNRATFRTLSELIWPSEDDPVYKADPSRFRVELHKRMSSPLYPLAAFVIAFAFLGSPRTTRQSQGLSIFGAVTAFIAIEIMGLGSFGLVARSPWAAALPYLAPLAGIALGLLSIGGVVESRVPAPLQRLADALVARFERLQTA